MVPNFPLLRLPSDPRRGLSRSFSPTLAEALRTNPFGSDLKLARRSDDCGDEIKQLNNELLALATFFPDIQAEVLRELLVRFPGESRLQLCIEQLLKYRAEWVRGRWNSPPIELRGDLPREQQFRNQAYKLAVKNNLCAEFRSLNRSTVDAVLAENNYSYTSSRPVLQVLAKKTWRVAIGNLNVFKWKKRDKEELPSQLFDLTNISSLPQLKPTGSVELDEELEVFFLTPAKKRREQEQIRSDAQKAHALNLAEATHTEALYECACCCGDITFEFMSTCTDGSHIICFECLRRAIQEALFGQGWSRSIDTARGSIKCLAPSIDSQCDGCIPQEIFRRAIGSDQLGRDVLAKFDERLATEAILNSRMTLIRCPFCSYAEADHTYDPSSQLTLSWKYKHITTISALLVLIAIINLAPILLLLSLLAIIYSPFRSNTLSLFYTSLHNLSLQRRSPRFLCRSPSCARASCLLCLKAWHDPHTCHEPLLISLRTTVEAARTAAVKRTCPRCGLSFVKASGCNKLTCMCGYAMCYLCRKALSGAADGRRRFGPGTENEEEGYRHFCEHFRVNPGKPCTECRKCDLYRVEDEEEMVRRAGEEAEREWRVREGMVGVEGLSGVAETKEKLSTLERLARGDWTVQQLVDWVTEKIIVVDT